MTLKKELCLLIEMYCREGYHKHMPTKTEHSYKTLAKQADVPVTTLQNWMNTSAEPSLANAQKVLSAMGYELVIKEKE